MISVTGKNYSINYPTFAQVCNSVQILVLLLPSWIIIASHFKLNFPFAFNFGFLASSSHQNLGLRFFHRFFAFKSTPTNEKFSTQVKTLIFSYFIARVCRFFGSF